MQFVDEIKIKVGSGHGGPGTVSFRREAMTPRGGPDGGDGGKGGDAIFQADERLNTLVDLRYKKKFIAEGGHSGAGANMSGHSGQDLIVRVPPGTLIKSQEGEVLKDLAPGERFVFLRGGRGGKGNNFFKNSVNQAPDHAQPGESGQLCDVTLELKLIADIGIIGFPNAGKSTLISRISAARPKIADYPFTTLVPNLGVVRIDDDRSFVVADIPGLITGAHLGVGLGTQFLRHIERTRFFLHLIDVSGVTGRDPLQDLRDINAELRAHDDMNKDREDFLPLSSRPQIVVLNKIDVIGPGEIEDLLRRVRALGFEAAAISGVSGAGVRDLLFAAGRKLFGD